MIIGEPQIVAQIKAAWRLSQQAEVDGPILHRVMDGALSVAKRVRTETGISREAVSIGRAGVELARQVLGDLSTTPALLIGAGTHGTLVARNLIGAGLSELIIANRTFSRASALAEQFGAAAVPLDDIHRYLERVDIVLTSTGAGRQLISRRELAPLMRRRRYRPMVLIDLSVPRVIDPAISSLDSVYRFDVDDLVQVADRGRRKRQDAAVSAEALVTAEVSRCWQSVIGQTYNPLIGQIPRQAEQIRKAELERAARQLSELSAREQAAVDAMTKAIVKKILHRPVSTARQLARTGDGENLAFLLSALTSENHDP